MNFVNAINAIRSNVWSVFLILLGAGLLLKGHEAAGTSLITGSFAIIKVSAEQGNGHTTSEVK